MFAWPISATSMPEKLSCTEDTFRDCAFPTSSSQSLLPQDAMVSVSKSRTNGKGACFEQEVPYPAVRKRLRLGAFGHEDEDVITSSSV